MRKQRLNEVLTVMFVMIAGVCNAATTVPRPEHPRPDLQRDNWLSLNGEWQFEIDKAADGEARGLTRGKDLASKIIVPFCPESKLSGLGLGNSEKLKDVWYRRAFEMSPAMKGKRVRIHFGGVDYKTWVYINGQLAGTHVGESSAFSFEITQWLKDGPNEVVVKVLDDMWSGLQPSGKQSPDQSQGCTYTRTTGIWQSVWLEAVGSTFVENISVVPDPDNSRVFITAKLNGLDKDLSLKAEAFLDGKSVGSDTTTGPWQNTLVVNLKTKKLWAPGTPNLYDLKLTLSSGNTIFDTLNSYFGLRSVAIDGRRILINGKPVFQRLILDQGFYPDGLWTAPTDEALKKDIELSMACGYNGARLHQKVFEPRFLYWADKLGYLVWGESPNWGFNFKPEGYAAYVNEWTEILLRDRNHPSIIGWCAFNETNGNVVADLQQMMWNVTKAVDPTRPAFETSGWTHTLPNPEVLDMHDYDGIEVSLRERWLGNLSVTSVTRSIPARYGSLKALPTKDRGVPFMVSEIGGIGWATGGGWGYGAGPKTLDEFYIRYKGTIDAMLDNPHLFGFCYTQLTDIEQEKNGLYYYDRKPKFDAKKLHEITSREAAYERNDPAKPAVKAAEPEWKVLVGALQDGELRTPYHYAIEKPADGWMKEGFDDASWKTGLAPFASDGEWTIGTKWTSGDIFFRKTFEYDGGEIKKGALVILYDEDTEVYVNGQKIFGAEKFITQYQLYPVTELLKKALKKGANTIAVHTHQTSGGQYIDLALLVE
ncbi:MAG: sugar-binding domain-containing protein [Verrucomicrobiaceae bacterium]